MKLRHLSVIFWIGACLLATELTLEYRAHERGWGTLLLGGMDAEERAEQTGFGATDAFPFRSAIVPAERRASVARLWFASSSYAQDTRLPVPLVFPNRTAALLTESGLPTETLNASRNGLVINANRRDLVDYGADWAPDIVLLYQMTNDIDRLGRAMHQSAGSSAPEENATAEPIQPGAGDIAASIQAVFEESTLYQQIKSNGTARLTAGRQLAKVLDQRADERFEHDLRGFIAAVRELGAEPVLCTFATSHTRANRDEAPPYIEQFLLRFNLFLSLDAWIDAVERWNGIIVRVGAEESVLVIDLAAVVAGESQHFRDFSHLERSGHELVARAVADALRGVLSR